MPTFDDAVKKAVRAFYEGHGFDSYEKKTGNKIKYNIDYFDDIEPSYNKKGKKEPEKEVEDDLDMEDILETDEEDE